MSASGYLECRGKVNEDYSIAITIEGSGSIASGWTFAGTLWDPDGNEVEDAVVVTITDAANRVVTATIAGQNLNATTYYSSYRFLIARTDAGSRTDVAWGPLELSDPSTSPPL